MSIKGEGEAGWKIKKAGLFRDPASGDDVFQGRSSECSGLLLTCADAFITTQHCHIHGAQWARGGGGCGLGDVDGVAHVSNSSLYV